MITTPGTETKSTTLDAGTKVAIPDAGRKVKKADRVTSPGTAFDVFYVRKSTKAGVQGDIINETEKTMADKNPADRCFRYCRNRMFLSG